MSARAFVLAIAVVGSLQLGISRPRGLGDVTAVRHWSYGGYTRVVVETSRAVETHIERLRADPRSGRPDRLYLDLPGVWIGMRYADPIPVGDGLLRAVRLGQNTKTRTRVVIDLQRYDRHRLLHLTDPPRVVVDVFAPGAPGGQDRRPSYGPMRTIVLDAGHGGRDPGARGLRGLREKDVTLGMARRLRSKLEAAGYRIVMTRDSDATRSLEERTAIAEGQGGDLFVSLHANAARRREARGIETYFLQEGHARHTLRVAARENGTSAARLDPLQRTLGRLRVGENSVSSSRLAHAVQDEVVRGLRGRYRRVDDLGVKSGPFYVLYLSSMPSVLVELGFLTNRIEAERLASEEYHDLVTTSLARGIDQYVRERNGRVARRQP